MNIPENIKISRLILNPLKNALYPAFDEGVLDFTLGSISIPGFDLGSNASDPHISEPDRSIPLVPLSHPITPTQSQVS